MSLSEMDICELGWEDELDLVPEAGVYGYLSGQKLPLEEVRKGRQTEVTKMAQFGVTEDVPESDAFGKEKISSKWLDGWEKLQGGPWVIRSRLVGTQVAYEKRNDAFAATPPLKGVRSLLSLASPKPPYRKRKLGRWDCSVAFFHAVMDEGVYCRPPKGMGRRGRMWRLWKALYGTRRASQLFQDLVKKVLTQDGNFTQVEVAPSLYGHNGWDIVVPVHGDGFLSEGVDESLQKLGVLLNEHFLIRELPKIGPEAASEGKFIGRTLRYTTDGYEYEADDKRLKKSMELTDVDENAKPADTPVSHDTGKSDRDIEELLDALDASRFQQGAGLALYFVLDRVDCMVRRESGDAGHGYAAEDRTAPIEAVDTLLERDAADGLEVPLAARVRSRHFGLVGQ